MHCSGCWAHKQAQIPFSRNSLSNLGCEGASVINTALCKGVVLTLVLGSGAMICTDSCTRLLSHTLHSFSQFFSPPADHLWPSIGFVPELARGWHLHVGNGYGCLQQLIGWCEFSLARSWGVLYHKIVLLGPIALRLAIYHAHPHRGKKFQVALCSDFLTHITYSCIGQQRCIHYSMDRGVWESILSRRTATVLLSVRIDFVLKTATHSGLHSASNPMYQRSPP